MTTVKAKFAGNSYAVIVVRNIVMFITLYRWAIHGITHFKAHNTGDKAGKAPGSVQPTCTPASVLTLWVP